MSAWYLFSTLGFYPIAPGSLQYSLGSPAIRSAVIKLEHGKVFTVEAKNQSEKNVYVQRVELNGRRLDRTYITHDEIASGGTLVYYMSAKPSR